MITDPFLSSPTITQPSHTPVKQVRRGVFQRRSNLTCVVWDEGSLIWLPVYVCGIGALSSWFLSSPAMVSILLNRSFKKHFSNTWRRRLQRYLRRRFISLSPEKCFSVSLFRSMRSTSHSKALAEGVSQDDIDVVNRWSLQERAKGRKVVGKKLRHYYADMPRLLTAHVRYTFAM